MEFILPVINFDPFPELQTDRLTLRRITKEDADQVFALRSDEETMKFIPRPLAKTKEDAVNFIEMIDKAIIANEFIHWGIALKMDNVLVGMICLIELQPENFRTEVGYILSPAFWGEGIMSEALDGVIQYAFKSLNFHSLGAIIDPGNRASEKLLLKKSFIKEACFKENRFFDGKFLDDAVYSLINESHVV